jgi:hypothetical protein
VLEQQRENGEPETRLELATPTLASLRWQLVTIAILGTRFRPELDDIHADSFQYVEDLIFVNLMLMAVTSFRPVSRHLSPAPWWRPHSTGIYLLGGLFSVNFLYFTLTETNTTYLVIMSAFVLLGFPALRRTITSNISLTTLMAIAG